MFVLVRKQGNYSTAREKGELEVLHWNWSILNFATREEESESEPLRSISSSRQSLEARAAAAGSTKTENSPESAREARVVC